MVLKLIKHELFALFRVLAFFAAAVILLALTGRILIVAVSSQTAENGFYALLILVVLFYVFSISALIFAAYWLGASRFYKTLFTGEGYMTFSLPMSSSRLLWGKLISSLIALVFAAAVSALSLVIFLVGWDSDIMQMVYEIIGIFGDMVSAIFAENPLLGAEYVIRYVFAAPMVLLAVFAVISVGQVFNSHRKAATFAILIGVYFVYNILSTVLIGPFARLSESVSPHLTNWIIIAIFAAIDAGCFFLIRYMLKNKLNLVE